ncbi:hypothetical protein L6Q96_13560 [Candidatus Binatia bacterium]|nr:hypothetical protein [Candidatus Binatia bacterium]
MRFLLVFALASWAGLAAAQDLPEPTAGTEVFSGAGEAPGPAERPPRPITTYWNVQLFMQLSGGPPSAHVAALLPLSDRHQTVLERRVAAEGFVYRDVPDAPNLRGSFTRVDPAVGSGRIAYDFTVAITDSSQTVPSVPLAALAVPERLRRYIEASPFIQSADPEVKRRARELIAGGRSAEDAAWALFQYTAAFVRGGAGEATEDALTVLREGRGSTAGKARLLAALLRSVGVPTRVVGGLKLADATKRRATISWVEAFFGDGWVPLDPGGGHFGWLPNDYLSLYRGDEPLLVHTSGTTLDYGFVVHRSSREGARAAAEPTPGPHGGGPETQVGGEQVRTASSYVERPVASVVVFADQSVPEAVTQRLLREAQADEIDVVLLTARFESRYFREQYLQRLILNNLSLVRGAHVVLVATHDDAGLYALMALGEKHLTLRDARVVVSGGFPRAVGRVLGTVLYRLVVPTGEVVLVDRPADLLALWEMVRANVINGVPMAEEAKKWDLDPVVLDRRSYEDLGVWRRVVVAGWVRAVRAQVPLEALTLILVLPVIAALIVVARTVVGVETFGTFSPVIVSLAFVTTGLQWGAAIFAAIVGVGAVVRGLLQRVRLQLVARLAILIAIVAGTMAGLTVLGASFGIGALINVSIFPMVIMAGVIENFSSSQAELGTREAIRLAVNTLVLAAICYLAVDFTGLQSVLLSFPELLVAAIAVDIGLGKWRGLRLLEYVRFFDLGRRAN